MVCESSLVLPKFDVPLPLETSPIVAVPLLLPALVVSTPTLSLLLFVEPAARPLNEPLAVINGLLALMVAFSFSE